MTDAGANDVGGFHTKERGDSHAKLEVAAEETEFAIQLQSKELNTVQMKWDTLARTYFPPMLFGPESLELESYKPICANLHSLNHASFVKDPFVNISAI